MLAQLAASLFLAAPNPHLRAAKIFYDEFQFSRCVQQLAQAGAAPATEVELVEIEVYGGLCRYSLGDFKGADEHFRLALKLDPRAALPPMTSPKLSERFEAERARLGPVPAAPEPAAQVAPAPADAPVQAELTPAAAPPTPQLTAA
ncbi:MAG: hypothetical protein K1X89_30225, partial [Myxococcaceae bacterium]|nr:hypothetical protein [Myxococcaceae bacterium]